MNPTVVVITGPVGSGKTTTMEALWELLDHEGEPVAMVDMDSLRALRPSDPADPFHAGLGIANLHMIWPQFAHRGAQWLLLTDVVEVPEQRTVYENAVPNARVIIVRLDVPLDRVHQQLRSRESGGSLTWHLDRSVELQSMMTERGIGDVVIPVDGQDPPEVAYLALEAVRRHLGSAQPQPEQVAGDPTITNFLDDPDPSAVIEFLAEWATSSHASAVDHVADHTTGEGTTLVARVDGTVAGLVTLRWTSRNPLFAERGIPLVHQLAVAQDFQRRGIATQLMDAAEGMAVDRGRQVIGITVGLTGAYGPAQRLYAKRGYVPDGRGVCLGREPLPAGQTVFDLNDLILWLTKDLKVDTCR